MGQHQVADRLVGDGADQSITLRASRGVACASTIITLSSPMMTPGIGVALGGEGPKPLADLGEADLFSVMSPARRRPWPWVVLLAGSGRGALVI
jgi:hypothetical protein